MAQSCVLITLRVPGQPTLTWELSADLEVSSAAAVELGSRALRRFGFRSARPKTATHREILSLGGASGTGIAKPPQPSPNKAAPWWDESILNEPLEDLGEFK
jgi:hypothetical protein